VEVAASRQGRHRDGAVFVSFVGTSPVRPDEAAALVVAGLARVLGVSLAVPRDPLDLLADHLAGRELLLVLDPASWHAPATSSAATSPRGSGPPRP
jgi:hypothetical protein